MNKRLTLGLAAVLAFGAFACTSDAPRNDPAADAGNAETKEPSRATRDRQAALRESLPFDDQRDFDEHQRGFIAAPDYRRIIAESGETVWDIGEYDFLLDGEDFDSIHPSLQRQATLNMNYGLYEVVPGNIYQVQLFASDDRGCCGARTQKWSDNSVSGAGNETRVFSHNESTFASQQTVLAGAPVRSDPFRDTGIRTLQDLPSSAELKTVRPRFAIVQECLDLPWQRSCGVS